MVSPSNCFIATKVVRSSCHKIEQCSYLTAIARVHNSQCYIKPLRFASQYRHFSQSRALLTELASSSNTSKTPYLDNKPRKVEERQENANNFGTGGQLPKQSSVTTRILFQIIAPHIESRILTQLTNRLSKIELDKPDRAGKEQSLQKMLDFLFEKGENNIDTDAAVKYAPSVKAHPWIKPAIHAYFMGKKLDVPNQQCVDTPSYQEDPTYPPNRNRHQQRKNLNIMIEARKMSILYNSESQSHVQLHLEAEEMLEKLSLHLPLSHFYNLMEKLRGFTMLGDKVRNDRTSWWIDNESNTPPDTTVSIDAKPNDAGLQKDSIRILCNALTYCSPTHSHLVADAFADYFCLDIQKPQIAKTDIGPQKEALDVVKHQREILITEKKYNNRRDKFVKDMMELQHIFASWGENFVSEGIGPGNTCQISTIDNVLIEKNDNEDDTSSDLSVKEFKKAQEPYSTQTRMEQKEKLKETLDELRRIGLEKEKEGAEKRKGKGRGRPQKGNHIRFTAVPLEEKNETSHPKLEIQDASDERIVFLNNLPIDTNEEEIDAIYSRCGNLDSIQLFNLRPDLDPGPLSTKQLKDRIRMKKLMRRKNTYASLSRPRTPVYARLRFQTDAGYRVATSQELCIFGCVIRRHPVLSIKSDDVTTIYLEQIPQHLFSIDVENMLGELLHPHKFSLMLDGTQGLGLNGYRKNTDGKHQEYSRPSSCQVRFVDYHTAAQAYQWIREERRAFCMNGNKFADDGVVQVHWFQTPSNSMEYWTRDLSF